MHRKQVTHSYGSYERKSRGRKLADEMGRGKKFAWYTHRLTHRKRVAYEVHDSYFRLMTIKHAILKIEWTLNYYITQSRQKSSGCCSYGWRRSYRRDVVGKATPGRGGPREPRRSLGTREVADKLLIRCNKESQHPAEWTPGPPVEHQENEKDITLTAIRVGSEYCSFCSVSSTLSHANFE